MVYNTTLTARFAENIDRCRFDKLMFVDEFVRGVRVVVNEFLRATTLKKPVEINKLIGLIAIEFSQNS